MKLAGKNVVITGASSGIGLELLKLFLEEGCRIVAAARSINKIALTHPNLSLFSCDVSSKEGVDSLFAYALRELRTIDLFVANAGFAYYEKIDIPDWSHINAIYNTNFISAIYSAERMKQLHGKNPFNFIVTASGMSFLSLPGYALYSSTKAALRSFAEAYRWELEKEQYFQVVYPIATRTNFFRQAGDSPIPWPVQDGKWVAQSIINGIRKDRNSIFPSKIFYLTKVLSNILPFINQLYARMQYESFSRWLTSRHE